VELDIGEDVKLWLIDEGYQPQYGARPMRRTLQKLLGDPLSEELIKGRFKDAGKIKVVLRDSAPLFIEEEVMASV
jgi:ATP-dependent Clp protease ATP-binding subunit ClpC